MLRRLTPQDALLARRCNRLFLEERDSAGPKGEAESSASESERFLELVLSRLKGPAKRVRTADEEESLVETAGLLDSHEPRAHIVHPAFATQEWFCRPELILHSPKEQGWRVYLVRPATGVRGAYMDEAAMVRLILEASGLPVVAVKLLFLDKEYRRSGELDPEALIRESDLTRRTEKRRKEARRLLDGAMLLAEGSKTVPADYRCETPGPCALCRREIASLPKHNILTLARGGREARQLYLQGIESILDIPEGVQLSWRQSIQLKSVRSNKLQVNRDRLAEFLERLDHPRVYLDFEAFNTAIPPVDGVGPWEHVPYLFSLHRQDEPGGTVCNHTFMMKPGVDDRGRMFHRLEALMGEAGSIIVFSAAFEAAMIRQLARVAGNPDRGEELIGRIEDLLEPFNDFVIYHPDQLGKVSMKRIVPIFTEESYEDLEVQDGLEANLAYGELFFSGGSGDAQVLSRLEEYCIQDTSGMVRLVERLEALASGG